MDAVDARLTADVPVGAFLSGGIGSSVVVAAMKLAGADPIHTFTITFEGFSHYDESAPARATAKHFGTDHHEIQAGRIQPDDLPDVIDAFDEPFGNPTALLVSSLSQATREHVKVALTGDGGDELFLGYPRYGGLRALAAYQKVPLPVRKGVARAVEAIRETPDGSHRARRAREFLASAVDEPSAAYTSWITYFSPDDEVRVARGRLEAAPQPSPDLLSSLMPSQELDPLAASRVDLQSFLTYNVLEYSDRMSMRHGLELRAPFVDHLLVDTVAGLPRSFRLGSMASKHAVREAFKQHLPDHALRGRKVGLNPPLGSWLRSSGTQVDDLLAPSVIRNRGILSGDGVQALRATHDSGKRDMSMHIWALMALEMWFRMRVD